MFIIKFLQHLLCLAIRTARCEEKKIVCYDAKIESQTDSCDVWQQFCMVMVEEGNKELSFFLYEYIFRSTICKAGQRNEP